MEGSSLLPPMELSIRHQVLEVGDPRFLDDPLLNIHNNEISLYKEGYRPVLVGGSLSSRDVNNLKRLSYLLEDHGGAGPVYARLEVLPPSRSGCSSSSDVFPSVMSHVKAVTYIIRSCSYAPLDLLRYMWVGGGGGCSLVPGPPSGERGGRTGSDGWLSLLLMSFIG